MGFRYKSVRPTVAEVKLNDEFWSDYIGRIRGTMLPYVFEKFRETGVMQNLESVAEGKRNCHVGAVFADGHLFQTMRAASDFLASEYDPELDAELDKLAALTRAASDAIEDGYFSTYIVLEHPEYRWGENGGDLVHLHDFYNQGALVEAGVSHYLATKKTDLLYAAVRTANNICKNVGEPPKKGVIPGHSLPEEAFVKLYRLFRDCRELDALAEEWGVDFEEYLRVTKFWYDARGKYTPEKNRMSTSRYYLSSEYYQNHIPFAEQRYAIGHAVRAPLCYLGAAAVCYDTEDAGYKLALDSIYENIVTKNLHITGGVGSRHDIEAFDEDYSIPNDAYLETCAAVGMAFFAGEMALLEPNSMYFDLFERALYNNVLSAIGEDFQSYFYQNPLENGDGHHRWSWHSCPCCPPMLLKLFASVPSYIYSHCYEGKRNRPRIFVNMYIGSSVKSPIADISQKARKLRIDSHGERVGVEFRIPEYAENFRVMIQGRPAPYIMKVEGYALIERIWFADDEIEVEFDEPIRIMAADPRVRADRGLVCVTKGAYVYCAEGYDNGGDVDFTVAREPKLREEQGRLVGLRADGGEFSLIPFAVRCNRGSLDNADRRMRVWLRSEREAVGNGDKLYFAI